MSSNGTVLYNDNDSAGELNSKINFYAYQGEVYYVIARGTNSSIRNSYNLIIN